MAIIVFQHWDVGAPGRLGITLRDHGFKLDVRWPDAARVPANLAQGVKTEIPPDLDNVSGVIILGGPQNVTDIAQLPWMQREAAFIKSAHDAGLPVIGICLGAQLIAHALGGKVDWKTGPDIGFRPTSISTLGQTETILAGVPWNHMNLYSCGQEVKSIPQGAMLLAGTPAMPVQAFKAGLRTYAFMFHFECDRPMAQALLSDGEPATRASDINAALDGNYANYARIADRLSVNIATFAFPFRKLLSA
ncbi:MAG: type 1 glutamine amidotransferase [Planctomycetota bacterium]|nr:type 1 glutamine amidotransferase [Planctomycetota bacterium]